MRKIDIEQGSYEWHLLRQGCVTGTTLKSALGSPKVQETLLNKLLAEKMTEPQIQEINAPQVVRGKEMEPIARKQLIEKTGENYTETGMLESDALPGFRISPDCIVETGGVVIGGAEIKCPDTKKHIEYIRSGSLPDEYRYQVMAPFIMSDSVEFWDFASYDDRPYINTLFVVRVERAEFPSIEQDRVKLREFLSKLNEAHVELCF